jgi:hypothetical protein
MGLQIILQYLFSIYFVKDCPKYLKNIYIHLGKKLMSKMKQFVSSKCEIILKIVNELDIGIKETRNNITF